MKTCSKCKEIKDLSDFCSNSRMKDSKNPYCKACDSLKQAKYYKDNKSRWKTYRAKNLDSIKEKHRSWQAANKEHIKNYVLKRNFGITLANYNNLLTKQQGCCAICETHYSKLGQDLSVDHCHDTGKVRALLCQSCNLGIGNINNSNVLRKAADYLELHSIYEALLEA